MPRARLFLFFTESKSPPCRKERDKDGAPCAETVNFHEGFIRNHHLANRSARSPFAKRSRALPDWAGEGACPYMGCRSL